MLAKRKGKRTKDAPTHNRTLDLQPKQGQVHHDWPDNHGGIVLPEDSQLQILNNFVLLLKSVITTVLEYKADLTLNFKCVCFAVFLSDESLLT